MSDFSRRVTPIVRDVQPERAVVIWKHYAETVEEAEARWRREHPGESLGSDVRKFFLVRWLELPSAAIF